VNTNEKCHFLHTLFNRLKRYKFNILEIYRLDFTGVYIVFEKGEFSHDLDRIVRIGTTTGKNTLLADRLTEHYENEGRSIFRNHIAICLLKKYGDPLQLSGLFYKGKNEKYQIDDKVGRENWKKYSATQNEINEYRNLNNKISEYIRENCSFTIFPVKRFDCGVWEKKLISTISTCVLCKQSENWLGNYIPKERKKISDYGLWNINHVNNKNVISKEDISELEHIIR